MRGLHIDPASGMAGDMFMAALLDCGLNLDDLRKELEKLPIDSFRIDVRDVRRGALRAKKVDVHVRDVDGVERVEGLATFHQPNIRQQHDHSHGEGRGFAEIVEIIRRARFSERARDRALRIFAVIAEAESTVHGTSLEDVHFHEVGAVDGIVDVCAAALGLELLGIEHVTASAIGIGHGTRKMQHGELPIPVPATAEIIQGMPVRMTSVPDELLTPTGAAILKVLVDEFLPRHDVVFERTGYGAGSTERADPPNVVRCSLYRMISSDETRGGEEVSVVETHVDDCSGEVIGHVRGLLEKAGALDVFVSSIQMKKNRPGFLVSVLVDPSQKDVIEDILLTETTSFGVRSHLVKRKTLARRIVTVNTPLGGARVKVGEWKGRIVQVAPEHVDCARLALASGLALHEVERIVVDAYHR